jgi:hypothetical protein
MADFVEKDPDQENGGDGDDNEPVPVSLLYCSLLVDFNIELILVGRRIYCDFRPCRQVRDC